MGMVIVATAATEPTTAEPARKRQRVQDDGPLQCLDALLDASHHNAAQPTDVKHETATYLDLPPIPRTSCPRA